MRKLKHMARCFPSTGLTRFLNLPWHPHLAWDNGVFTFDHLTPPKSGTDRNTIPIWRSGEKQAPAKGNNWVITWDILR